MKKLLTVILILFSIVGYSQTVDGVKKATIEGTTSVKSPKHIVPSSSAQAVGAITNKNDTLYWGLYPIIFGLEHDPYYIGDTVKIPYLGQANTFNKTQTAPNLILTNLASDGTRTKVLTVDENGNVLQANFPTPYASDTSETDPYYWADTNNIAYLNQENLFTKRQIISATAPDWAYNTLLSINGNVGLPAGSKISFDADVDSFSHMFSTADNTLGFGIGTMIFASSTGNFTFKSGEETTGLAHFQSWNEEGLKMSLALNHRLSAFNYHTVLDVFGGIMTDTVFTLHATNFKADFCVDENNANTFQILLEDANPLIAYNVDTYKSYFGNSAIMADGLKNKIGVFNSNPKSVLDVTGSVRSSDTVFAKKVFISNVPNVANPDSGLYIENGQIVRGYNAVYKKPQFAVAVDSTLIELLTVHLFGYSQGFVVDTVVFGAPTSTDAATPNVTVEIWYGPDYSLTGTRVFNAGQTITSNTVGHKLSSFGHSTIPCGNWIWMTFTNVATLPKSVFVQIIGH